MTGYKEDEMMLTDKQRKRGVEIRNIIWKENGIIHIPFQIHSHCKYLQELF